MREVEGPSKGSYMKLYEELYPVQRDLNVSSTFVKELRGLWNMHGAFMGGPFICYSFVEKSTSKMILFYGYVFAPKFDKREYLRELEAVGLSGIE